MHLSKYIAQKLVLFTLLVLVFTVKAIAQNFVIDTTDNRIAYYKALVNKNNSLVHFIESILMQQDIPKCLRNLAIIESGLNNNSLSLARAAGTWQFTPSAAVDYGMEISRKNDDRYDLYKSTYAAAKYLGDLFKIYHDWKLVVAAYNCGMGNVNKAIKKAGSNNYTILCNYLPNETREHVKKFILACYATNELKIVETQDNYFVESAVRPAAINYAEQVAQTEISGGYKLMIIAQYLQMPIEQIETLNPCIYDDLAKNGFAKLILPVDKMPDFLLQRLTILNSSIN